MSLFISSRLTLLLRLNEIHISFYTQPTSKRIASSLAVKNLPSRNTLFNQSSWVMSLFAAGKPVGFTFGEQQSLRACSLITIGSDPVSLRNFVSLLSTFSVVCRNFQLPTSFIALVVIRFIRFCRPLWLPTQVHSRGRRPKFEKLYRETWIDCLFEC